ncbi:hypothetical protein H4V97_002592 [Flavobacterium sp. CG_23.5]|nr:MULTISPECIES: hypothetical protein [unclassified Flavobacterium]MBG6110355.1 hypothetical protein [Flavobacterium sp. CG_9.10]MBP2284274.1 hypothetical protein [Flavobacterium sp. CG_23.5]
MEWQKKDFISGRLTSELALISNKLLFQIIAIDLKDPEGVGFPELIVLLS